MYEDPAGSGVFWARWKGIDGRDRKKRVGSLSRAKEYRARMVAEVRDRILFPERYVEPEVGPEPWTLREAIADYQANSRANRDSHSHSTDGYHGETLAATWGDRLIDSIQAVEVRDWMTRRMRDHRPNTVNRERGFLKRVARRAIECGRASRDPTVGVKPLKAGRKPPRYLLPEEEARLREQLTGRDWLTVELAYRTGLRQSEQFLLKKDQVDLRARYIVLGDPKSKEPETLPLNSRAVEVLRELMDTRSPWVFPASRGDGPMQVKWWLSHVFRPALVRAGIRDFSWHGLRHTTASWLAIAGVDLARIQRIMRHRSYAMTLVYAHLQPDHLADAIEAIAGLPPTGRTHRIGDGTNSSATEPGTNSSARVEPTGNGFQRNR